ncbi:hypothetical protein NZK33_14525 [Cyanobium sp. FGCU-6]|nr:hypothetical protein [Cyanobium sp. FGCU6]
MGNKESKSVSIPDSDQPDLLSTAKDSRHSLSAHPISHPVVHLDPPCTSCRNELELRFIGIMRSGNHAVIQWIQQLFHDKKLVFLNNIKHSDHNPFNSFAQIEYFGYGNPLSYDELINCSKDVLIYSYEDRRSVQEDGIDFLASVFNEKFELKREFYLGASKQRLDLFVIRDPFNLFASRLQMIRKDPCGGIDLFGLVIENWKLLAERIIQLQQAPAERQIPILYNRLITDESYQRSIAHRLRGEFVPFSLQKISEYGLGSSFATFSHLSVSDLFLKAHKLLYLKKWIHVRKHLKRLKRNQSSTFLTRWQLLAADKEYRQIFRDPEILYLSERLFGEIPGTRQFVEQILGNKE